jgi:hypothetical protein
LIYALIARGHPKFCIIFFVSSIVYTLLLTIKLVVQCSPSVKKWACTPADLCYHTSLLAKPGIMVTHSFFLCTSTAFLLSTRLRCTLKKISGRPGFKTVLPTFQCTSVYFWYIPESLRGLSETEDWWKKVDRVRTVRRTSCCDIHGHRALFDPSSLKKTPS